MIPHIMIIQSAYTDRRLSERRLEISRHTSIPSLRYQSEKPVVHIAVNPADPFLSERLEAFAKSSRSIVPTGNCTVRTGNSRTDGRSSAEWTTTTLSVPSIASRHEHRLQSQASGI